MIANQSTSSGCCKPCSWKSSEVNWTQSPKPQARKILDLEFVRKKIQEAESEFSHSMLQFIVLLFSYKRTSLLCAHIASLPLQEVFAFHEAFWFTWLPPSYYRRSLTAEPLASSSVTLTDISTLCGTNRCTMYDH